MQNFEVIPNNMSSESLHQFFTKKKWNKNTITCIEAEICALEEGLWVLFWTHLKKVFHCIDMYM